MLTIAKLNRRMLQPAFLLTCCLLAGCTQLQTIVCAPQEKTPVCPQTTINTEFLTKEGPAKATRTLEEIVTRPPVPGITDEALFLLALFNLNGSTREATGKAQQNLHRLAKDYPLSPWSQVGQPVLELLDTVAEQRRQIATLKNQHQSLNKEITTLKNQNQTLSKESRELHQAIQQLKTLDLELEKKSRH